MDTPTSLGPTLHHGATPLLHDLGLLIPLALLALAYLGHRATSAPKGSPETSVYSLAGMEILVLFLTLPVFLGIGYSLDQTLGIPQVLVMLTLTLAALPALLLPRLGNHPAHASEEGPHRGGPRTSPIRRS